MTIEQDILLIKERNAKVEADKAWETSWTRKTGILIVTYVIAMIVMWTIGVEKPYIDAIIPTTGFFLSTLSLRFLRKFWLNKIYKNEGVK